MPKTSLSNLGGRISWYCYTARQLAPETGLDYYRARYYDPESAASCRRPTALFAGRIGGDHRYSHAESAGSRNERDVSENDCTLVPVGPGIPRYNDDFSGTNESSSRLHYQLRRQDRLPSNIPATAGIHQV
jgi:hypothetical protein